jgi:GxxExxY protein
MSKEFLYRDLSYQIIGACFHVHSKIGCGLPEPCYYRPIEMELNILGIPVCTQRKFDLFYNEEEVGSFYCDLVIDNKIVLEIKSLDKLLSCHELSLLHIYELLS